MRIIFDMSTCGPERGRTLVAQLEIMGFVLVPESATNGKLLVSAYKGETDPTDLIYAKQKLNRYGAAFVDVTNECLLLSEDETK